MWPPCGRIWMWRCPSRRPTCCIVPFIVMSLQMVWEIKLVIFGGKRGVTPAFGGSLEGMWAAGVQVGVRLWVSWG